MAIIRVNSEDARFARELLRGLRPAVKERPYRGKLFTTDFYDSLFAGLPGPSEPEQESMPGGFDGVDALDLADG